MRDATVSAWACSDERLAQVRRAGGDPAGAMLAARRAVELVPRETSPERATVLAGLAQLKMLDGVFSDAQHFAREAIREPPDVRSAGTQPGGPRDRQGHGLPRGRAGHQVARRAGAQSHAPAMDDRDAIAQRLGLVQ